MSFMNKVQTMSAANAKLPSALEEGWYRGTIMTMNWPAEDDEEQSFTNKDGKSIAYINPEVKVKVLEYAGDVEDLSEVGAGALERLPREISFRVFISEDNPDSGLLVYQSLVYDALELGDIEADAEAEKPVVEYFEECIGSEVLVYIGNSPRKDKDTKKPMANPDGTPVYNMDLKSFAAA